MKKLAMALILVGCICLLSGCLSTPANKPTPRIDLLQKQAVILECSESYMACLKELDPTGDYPALELGINECVEAANFCKEGL